MLPQNYGVPREQVMNRLVELLRKRNITVLGQDRTLVASALLLCRPSGRVNYANAHANALINADARGHAVERLYTFDERFPSEGLTLERPLG